MTTEEVIKYIRDKDLLSSEEALEILRALTQEQKTKFEDINDEWQYMGDEC